MKTLAEIRAMVNDKNEQAIVDDIEKLSDDERGNPITYEQFKIWESLKHPVPKTKLVEYGDYSNTIKCPHCGEENLHHLGIETFHREEDQTGYHVELYDETSHGWGMLNIICPNNSVNDNTKTNPSGRRGGILILFGCEGCHNISKLGIAQHKGQSLLSWNFKV
jgi:hypothetical protein